MKKVLPKPTILQLDEYDVNQRVIEALTNVCSHAVLFSIVDKAKDAGEISNDLQISISNDNLILNGHFLLQPIKT